MQNRWKLMHNILKVNPSDYEVTFIGLYFRVRQGVRQSYISPGQYALSNESFGDQELSTSTQHGIQNAI